MKKRHQLINTYTQITIVFKKNKIQAIAGAFQKKASAQHKSCINKTTPEIVVFDFYTAVFFSSFCLRSSCTLFLSDNGLIF